MKKILAIGVLALTSATAWSADDGDHWYVMPQLGYTFSDDDRNVDDDLHYGLAVGKHLSDKWSVELNGLVGNHDGKSGGDLDITAISADVLRVFRSDSRVSPFVTAGVGYLTNDPNPGSSLDDFMAQVGGGALIRAWQNANGSHAFNIRPQAKLRWDDAHSAGRLVDILVGVGFEFNFGAPTVRAAAVAPAPAPVVAPPPAPRPAPPPPVVAAPRDTDGDGVMDDKDQCAGTPRGTAVDAVGCPRKGSITLTGVQFETNSAKLKAESYAPLNAVAADLKPFPRLKVEIQGHTDSVGADAYNLTLSQGRADSVREYLISQGVTAAQLTAKGYGESKPIADNKTAEGRAQNRRVAMDVTDNPGDVQINKTN